MAQFLKCLCGIEIIGPLINVCTFCTAFAGGLITTNTLNLGKKSAEDIIALYIAAEQM